MRQLCVCQQFNQNFLKSTPATLKRTSGPLAAFLCLFPLFAGLHRLCYLLRAKDPLDPCIVGEGRKNSQVPSERNLRVLISSYSHSTGEGCSAVFFLVFRPSVLPLCYPFLVVHLVHGSRAPIIEPRAKMGSHQRGGWGPVPRIEYIISGGRAQGEGTAEGLALPPR